MRRGTAHQLRQVREPRVGRHQGAARLEAQVALLQVRVRRFDIGGIGDQQVKTPTRQGAVPVRGEEPHPFQAQVGSVVCCYPQRLLAGIHALHQPGVALAGQGQGDGAGARSQVQHLGVRGQGQFQRPGHQGLGLRSGYEGVRIDLELQRPELAPARQVGNGFTARPPRQQLPVVFDPLSGGFALGPGIQPGA